MNEYGHQYDYDFNARCFSYHFIVYLYNYLLAIISENHMTVHDCDNSMYLNVDVKLDSFNVYIDILDIFICIDIFI